MILGGRRIETAVEAGRYSAMLSREVGIGELVKEEPCVPPGVLQMISEREGRPCPRVALAPENAVPAAIVQMCSSPQLRPLIHPFFESYMSGCGPLERRAMLDRTLAALGNPEVVEAMKPQDALSETIADA